VERGRVVGVRKRGVEGEGDECRRGWGRGGNGEGRRGEERGGGGGEGWGKDARILDIEEG